MQAQNLPSSFNAALEPVRYINVVEVAKLVRSALKEAFPEVKFSVRSDKYAGGASVDVRWQDGPIAALVDKIIKPFQGGGFDGMSDLKYSLYQSMNGRRVSFNADYVFGHREISKERIEAVEAEISKVDRDLWLTIAVEAGHPSPCAAIDHARNARDLAWQILANVCDAKWEGRRSALAESVEYLGDSHQNPPV